MKFRMPPRTVEDATIVIMNINAVIRIKINETGD